MSLILILATILFTICILLLMMAINEREGSIVFLLYLMTLFIGYIMYILATNISETKDYDDFVEEYSITEKAQLNDSIWYTTQVGIDTTYYNVKTVIDTIK